MILKPSHTAPTKPVTMIVITVLKIDRNKIRIGIDAPKDVHILREELLPPDQKLPPFEVKS